jgi:hypothetical protein
MLSCHLGRSTFAQLAATSLIVLSGLAAAQTWSLPQFVTSATLPIGASTNGAGTSAILFTTGSDLQATVQTGGKWSSPVVLSSTTTLGLVAVAPDGDVVALWSTSTALQAAFFSGGHWGSPITLDSNAASINTLNVGVDGHSSDTVVWEHRTSSTCSLVAVTGTASAGFGSSEAIGAACTGWASLAVNSSGAAIVAQGATTLEVAPIIGTLRATNGTWGAPFDIATPYYGRQRPHVALGNNGTAVAVWRGRVRSEWAADDTGTWTAPAYLAQASGTPGIAVDGNDNAVAPYSGNVTYRPFEGVFQTPVALGNTLQVVASPAGTFMVTGSSVATLLPGHTAWNQNGPDSSLLAIAPGQALAIVSPLISVSTASVP